MEINVNYRNGKKHEDYLVALETHSGKKIYVTDVSMFLVSEKKLQNQINEAIQNKAQFTKTFREDFLLSLGLILIITGIFLQWYESGKRKKNKKTQEVKMNEERKQLLNRPQQNNCDYQNSNKKNTNDSISK